MAVLFDVNQTLIHVATRKKYRITAIPQQFKRLEHCDEPYYEYQDLETYNIWARRKSEMEDGRFIAA